MKKLALITMVPLLWVTAAFAGDAQIVDYDFYLEDDPETPQDVFSPDAPKIILALDIEEVRGKPKLTCDWIAVRTKVAPPNYMIDSNSFTLTQKTGQAVCSLSRPNKGFPLGEYRVDVKIDGRQVETAEFTVEDE